MSLRLVPASMEPWEIEYHAMDDNWRGGTFWFEAHAHDRCTLNDAVTIIIRRRELQVWWRRLWRWMVTR